MARSRTSAFDRDVAMLLAATEYDRFARLLRSLGPADWERQTCCPGWDVRAAAGHVLGMAEFAASLREQTRQLAKFTLRARRTGESLLDAQTALQVEEHAGLSREQVVAGIEAIGPKAVAWRRRTPGVVRARTIPWSQAAGDTKESWTFGYLVDTILTRDTWTHRTDIADATGAELELTAEHDGLLVADVVQEWAQRHGQPFELTLTGPAGGHWARGEGGPSIELDPVTFWRMLSGRAQGEGLLAVQVAV